MSCAGTSLFACQCSLFFVPCGSGPRGRSAFAHVKSKRRKAHPLKSLEDVVSREVDAPYTVQHLLDTGHILLTAVAGGGGGGCGANPTAPTLWEKTMTAVWRIWSLNLSRTEAQYLTLHLVGGVPWEDV